VIAFAHRLEHQLLHGGSDAERAIRQKLKADLTNLLKEEAVSASVSIKFEIVLAFASVFLLVHHARTLHHRQTKACHLGH
jgi:dihydroneopterin aldolase